MVLYFDDGTELNWYNNSGGFGSVNHTVALDDDQWHHVAATYDNTTYRLYLDGTEVANLVAGDYNLGVITGEGIGGTGNTTGWAGQIDETAVWSRSLHADEIKQLYRRGANRVKYQVRSCDDPACSEESWQGSDSSLGSVFSELHNNDSIDVSGKAEGNVITDSPSFSFLDFPVAARPNNNRYFQYRILMQAEDNSLCNSDTEPCLPEVESVEIGPIGRYYAGAPVIETNIAFTYADLYLMTFTAVGSCQMSYQLSPDGTNYYYWNGSAWTLASGEVATESSDATSMSDNIKTFASTAGSGGLKVKTFLNSDFNSSCEVDNIQLSY